MILKERPSDFNKSMDVVGCFIEFENKFILLHRQNHKSYGGTWGMPAGKADFGETLPKAMLREIAEETGIILSENELVYIKTLIVRHEDVDFEYHMFSVLVTVEPQVKINSDEHQSYVWVSPEEALTMNLIYGLDECIRISYTIE